MLNVGERRAEAASHLVGTSDEVSASELKAKIRDGHELAILDVRETGVFSQGHLLYAISLPLSHLELRIGRLVPRMATRIVVCDNGEGLAQQATARLRQLGYANVTLLKDGLSGWRKAEYEVFTGTNVYSKAFSEVLEHQLDTPRLSAAELHKLLASNADVVVLDSRTEQEFRTSAIPGAHSCPGGELVHRVRSITASPKTTVVVNCAGRTRSIIGTQSLVNAGLANRVVALQNGTMAWSLAGFELEKGRDSALPNPDPQALAWSQAAAQRLAYATGIQRIDLKAIKAYRADSSRTLYLIDVRSELEYRQGHLPGSIWVPGGQLLQTLDEHVGTTNSRVVVIDSEQVRAPVVASWLSQMGWSRVFTFSLEGQQIEHEFGGGSIDARPIVEPFQTIDARELREGLASGTHVVLDLDPSSSYRKGHIPGSWFVIRSRLPDLTQKLAAKDEIALTSKDSTLAHLAARELSALVSNPVRVLAGGTEAWKAAGYPLSAADTFWAHVPDDEWSPPETEQQMRDYLTWELNLVDQIRRDGDARYRILKIAH